MLSQLTQLPIVVITANARRARRLSSWDRTWVQWPLSRVDIGLEVLEREELVACGDRDSQLRFLESRLGKSPISNVTTPSE